MRIPQEGMKVMYVVRAASPQDNRPAEMRPATIVNVRNYNSTIAVCNLMIMLDGEADAKKMGSSAPGQQIHGLSMWIPDVAFDSSGTTANTFQWMEDQRANCEIFKTCANISHGRELIKRGAEGLWDQKKNTITFNREDINDLHADLQPTYRADCFIDQHCARLMLPKGYFWVTSNEPNDGLERAGERQHLVEIVSQLPGESSIQEQLESAFNGLLQRMGLPAYPRKLILPIWQYPQLLQEQQEEIESLQEAIVRGGDAILGTSEEIPPQYRRQEQGRRLQLDDRNQKTSTTQRQQQNKEQPATSR